MCLCNYQLAGDGTALKVQHCLEAHGYGVLYDKDNSQGYGVIPDISKRRAHKKQIKEDIQRCDVVVPIISEKFDELLPIGPERMLDSWTFQHLKVRGF